MPLPPLLSLLIWIPIVAGLVVLRAGSDAARSRTRWLALTGAVAGFLPVIPLVSNFRNDVTSMQFVENVRWSPTFDIAWLLGVDGISLWLVPLTPLTTIIFFVAPWEFITPPTTPSFSPFPFSSGSPPASFPPPPPLLSS